MDFELEGIVEGVGAGGLIGGAVAVVEAWNWIDHAANAVWMARGKQQVWFDYVALLELGLSGGDLEDKLNRLGIRVYGKDILACEDGLLAFVLVDANRVGMVRNMLSKMGVLIG